jgi:hypothetical protein
MALPDRIPFGQLIPYSAEASKGEIFVPGL